MAVTSHKQYNDLIRKLDLFPVWVYLRSPVLVPSLPQSPGAMERRL